MDDLEVAESLELDPKYNNHTCGLCGDYNGVQIFDEFLSGDIILSPAQFGNLQNIHDPVDICTDVDETLIANTDHCSQYRSVCEEHLGHAAFSDCKDLLNVEAYITACMMDMCSCGLSQDSFCLCSTISEYSRQCSHAGGRPGNWRTDSFCPKKCPANMIYQESASPCKSSCSHLEIHNLCEEHYMDGCFCPEGTVHDDYTFKGCVAVSECHCKHGGTLYAPGKTIKKDCDKCRCESGRWNCTDNSCPGVCSIEGGSHITTFDGKAYTFHGNCYYVLSKARENESHTILGELVPCSSSDRETCLKSVVLITDNPQNIVIFKADGTVLLNYLEVTLPHITASFSIIQPSDSFIIAQATSGPQMQIQLSPVMQLYITMEKSSRRKLHGLCGNFNSKETDDFKTSGGLVEATASAFANTWKAQPTCRDMSDVLDDPCSLSIEKDKYARSWCSELKKHESPFAKCHSTIDPTEYVKRCRYDTCSCEDSEQCMCAALSSYVKACAAKGIILWGWRNGICDQNITSCPSSQVFLYNLTTCQPTCRSLADGEKACTGAFSPVEGCGCPDGEFLNEKGSCVPISQCSCYHRGEYLKPLQMIPLQNELCTCRNGKLDCTVRVNQTCPPGKVYYDCNKEQKGVSKTPVHRSCKTLGVEYFQTECLSGCVCPYGLYDDGFGSCVPEVKCPCYHNEDIYPHGTNIKVDCNTCLCQHGQWTCTDAVCYGTCTIYGSGHYITFDDKLYDFDGECEFVAAQDYCDNSDGNFSIITENVRCGTTGVTCSKSIKVFLGNKILKLAEKTIQKMEGQGGNHVDYLTREVGNYLVIEASNGIILIWDRKTTLFIKVSPAYKGKLCGLCGNFDGNSQNDFKTSHMLPVTNVMEFGNSWKLDSTCPEYSAVINPCSQNPHRRSWAEKQCSIIKGQVFQACHSKVDPKPFYEACVTDSCSCDSGGDCDCFCTAVAAYGQECTKAGACVYWRTPDICPIFCDYYNPQDECEWHYHPCGNHNIETCRSINNIYTNVSITYLEGCYPTCPPEKPIFDEESKKCVTKDDCGCFFNNTQYKIGEEVPNYRDCYKCVCHPGKVDCKVTDYNTTTSVDNGLCKVTTCEKGNKTIHLDVCASTTPRTTSTTPVTSVHISTTAVTTPLTTTTQHALSTCVYEKVCQWSQWFDVSKPEDSIDSGDYETYNEIRKHYKLCSVPEQIQCRAVNAPDVPLNDLKQTVHCNVSNGLVCKNSEQKPDDSLWQKCYNYEIRVDCCDYECVTTTAPTTTKPTTTPTTTTTTTSIITTPTTTSTAPTTTSASTPSSASSSVASTISSTVPTEIKTTPTSTHLGTTTPIASTPPSTSPTTATPKTTTSTSITSHTSTTPKSSTPSTSSPATSTPKTPKPSTSSHTTTAPVTTASVTTHSASTSPHSTISVTTPSTSSTITSPTSTRPKPSTPSASSATTATPKTTKPSTSSHTTTAPVTTASVTTHSASTSPHSTISVTTPSTSSTITSPTSTRPKPSTPSASSATTATPKTTKPSTSSHTTTAPVTTASVTTHSASTSPHSTISVTTPSTSSTITSPTSTRPKPSTPSASSATTATPKTTTPSMAVSTSTTTKTTISFPPHTSTSPVTTSSGISTGTKTTEVTSTPETSTTTKTTTTELTTTASFNINTFTTPTTSGPISQPQVETTSSVTSTTTIQTTTSKATGSTTVTATSPTVSTSEITAAPTSLLTTSVLGTTTGAPPTESSSTTGRTTEKQTSTESTSASTTKGTATSTPEFPTTSSGKTPHTSVGSTPTLGPEATTTAATVTASTSETEIPTTSQKTSPPTELTTKTTHIPSESQPTPATEKTSTITTEHTTLPTSTGEFTTTFTYTTSVVSTTGVTPTESSTTTGETTEKQTSTESTPASTTKGTATSTPEFPTTSSGKTLHTSVGSTPTLGPEATTSAATVTASTIESKITTTSEKTSPSTELTTTTTHIPSESQPTPTTEKTSTITELTTTTTHIPSESQPTPTTEKTSTIPTEHTTLPTSTGESTTTFTSTIPAVSTTTGVTPTEISTTTGETTEKQTSTESTPASTTKGIATSTPEFRTTSSGKTPHTSVGSTPTLGPEATTSAATVTASTSETEIPTTSQKTSEKTPHTSVGSTPTLGPEATTSAATVTASTSETEITTTSEKTSPSTEFTTTTTHIPSESQPTPATEKISTIITEHTTLLISTKTSAEATTASSTTEGGTTGFHTSSESTQATTTKGTATSTATSASTSGKTTPSTVMTSKPTSTEAATTSKSLYTTNTSPTTTTENIPSSSTHLSSTTIIQDTTITTTKHTSPEVSIPIETTSESTPKTATSTITEAFTTPVPSSGPTMTHEASSTTSEIPPVTTSITTLPVTYSTQETTITSSTMCVCVHNGSSFGPGEITSGVTDDTCYKVICTPECQIQVQHWSCSTTPPTRSPNTLLTSSQTSPSTNTTTPSTTTKQTSTTVTKTTITTTEVKTTPPTGCILDRHYEEDEVWSLCNCTKARCLKNNTVEITHVKCEPPPKIKCANGRPPVPVPDDDLCCWHWECDCVCSGWGNLHYRTFDGTYYSFQGMCTYALVEEINKKTDNFGIYVDNSNCGSQDQVLCSRNIIVHYETQEIQMKKSLPHNDVQVVVNGDVVSVPYSKYGVHIYKAGIYHIVEIPDKHTNVTFNGDEFSVKIPYNYFGNNTQGQCGTCTNDQTDDCRTSSGKVVSSCEAMADTWIVHDPNKPTCDRNKPTPPSTTTKPPVVCPPSPMCDLIMGPIFQECHNTIPPHDYHKACVFDSCHGTSSNMSCTSLQHYARLCGDHGICINWRSQVFECPLECPSHQVYNACGSAVPRTCQTTLEEDLLIENDKRVAEGCFCPAGSMSFSPAMDVCVSTCGCVGPDRIPREFGEEFQSNCQNCVCREGGSGITCQKRQCSKVKPIKCDLDGFYADIQINPLDPCCNESVCKCDPNKCSTTPPICDLGYEAIGDIPEGHCCTVYTCVRKNVCVHEQAEYLPGAPVYSDKCQNCVCSESANTTERIEIQCKPVQCNKQCPVGFELKQSTLDCCGVCEQTHCVLKQDGLDELIKPGGNIRSEDNCSTYSCTVIRDQFITSISSITCPAFNEDNCEPGTIEVLPNGCCKICIEKSTGCKRYEDYDYLYDNNCKSREKVKLARCDGLCETLSVYSVAARSMSHTCSCCQEVRTSKKKVMMQCADGSEVEHEYIDVEECNCVSTDCMAAQSPAKVRRSAKGQKRSLKFLK
ncbi:mucin-5B-like [Pyxicephalus adspersus]|uniref:mucin-5B-like n=1 Tax=Pyxicephalus adspersus TaxID=30357 RepID=UPI003B593272